MSLRVEALPIPGPLLLHAPRFEDSRGCFAEIFRQDALQQATGLATSFVQDNFSLSRQAGVVRGLHFQLPPHAQAKLVRVLRGAVLDIVVDIRRSSPHFGRHLAVRLSAEEWQQLWIPAGFAHGFCTLLPDTEVLYKVSDVYAPDCDRGIAWDDPDLAIDWPVGRETAILSDKDRRNPRLRDLPPAFG